MKNITIERIEIVSFGKLKMIQVKPETGINLLSAPNESGKSTLAAFIKFIFYGYTSGRMQSIIENDKKLYTPWDNPQSEGAVYISTDSGRYKIERKYLQSGKEALEVFETRSGRSLNTGVQPGEYFFGVNEQVFEKTAFFRQLTLPSSKDDYIAEQLQNIAMSADEKINTKKALERLTKAKNMLSGRAGRGLIPKLEEEREELEIKLAQASEVNRQVQAYSDKIAEAKRFVSDHGRIIAELNDEHKNIIKYEAFLRLTNLRELERNKVQSEKDYQETAALLKKKELPGSQRINSLMTQNAVYKTDCRSREKVFDDLRREESELERLQSEGSIDRRTAENAKKKAKLYRMTSIASALMSVMLAAGGAFLIWLLVPAVLTAAATAAAVIAQRRLFKTHNAAGYGELMAKMSDYPLVEQRITDKKQKIISLNDLYTELVKKTEEQKKKLEADISEYVDIDNSMSYDEQIEYISEAAQKIAKKQFVYREKCESFEKRVSEVNVEALAEEASGAVKPEREKSKVEKELSFYSKQMKIYQDRERENERQKAMLEGKGSDPAVITGKLQAVKAGITEYNSKHASLELAIEKLNAASDYMKSTVAPRINRYAGEFFNRATNEKYKALSVDTALAMSFADEAGEKSCDYLSAGTRDSAYLCLRLALIRLLYGEINPPIILDDAFGRIDDDRLEAMLILLSEAETGSQIFIFTCGEREKELLQAAGKTYTELSLTQK